MLWMFKVLLEHVAKERIKPVFTDNMRMSDLRRSHYDLFHDTRYVPVKEIRIRGSFCFGANFC